MSAAKGQTMVEYVLMFCALLAVVGALCHFLRATRHSVDRAERLAGSDYP